MTQDQRTEFANRARAVYTRHKDSLEQLHINKFIAIEPESGDYFLGDTLDDAVDRAQEVHPDKLVHVMRVGHRAAVHLGIGGVRRQ